MHAAPLCTPAAITAARSCSRESAGRVCDGGTAPFAVCAVRRMRRATPRPADSPTGREPLRHRRLDGVEEVASLLAAGSAIGKARRDPRRTTTAGGLPLGRVDAGPSRPHTGLPMSLAQRALRALSIIGLVLLGAGCPPFLPGIERSLGDGAVDGPVAADVGTPASTDVALAADRPLPADRPAAADVPSADAGAADLKDVGPQDPPDCGGAGRGGQPCCAADRCNDHYVCRDRTCAPCGGNREACCADGRCDGRRVCEGGTCR